MYWNPYGYVGGNPVNFTDPSGEIAWFGVLAAVLIGGCTGLGIGSELVFNQDRCYNGCGRTLTDQWSAGEVLDVFEAGATGAFAGASAALALSTAYSYPIATLLYAGGYHAYNQADTGGANSFNLLGVLSGYDFIQSGFDTLRNDPNPVSKLGGFGNVALNIGLGGALFHGIGEASKTAILASRLSMSNTNRLSYLARYLGDRSIALQQSNRFYRAIGQRAIEVDSALLARTGWRSAWELASGVSHEMAHVYQEFGRNILGLSRGNVLPPLQRLSAWSGPAPLSAIEKHFSFVTFGYLFNPVEISAAARGIFSTHNLAITIAPQVFQMQSALLGITNIRVNAEEVFSQFSSYHTVQQPRLSWR